MAQAGLEFVMVAPTGFELLTLLSAPLPPACPLPPAYLSFEHWGFRCTTLMSCFVLGFCWYTWPSASLSPPSLVLLAPGSCMLSDEKAEGFTSRVQDWVGEEHRMPLL